MIQCLSNFKYSFLLTALLLLTSFNLAAQYCAPQYIAPCQFDGILNGIFHSTDDYIGNFSTTNGISNITNNNSGCNGQPNSFIYYPSMTVSAAQGCSFNVSMKAGGIYEQGFAIWIDWNNDLDYNDAGEKVFTANSTLSTVTGVIQIPATATVGIKRMRVRSCYYVTPTHPCNLQGPTNENYGEVEEFNVEVLPATNTTLSVSDTSVCAGTSTQITATSSGTVKWYFSQNSTVAIFTGPTFTTPVLNSSTTYWVQASFGSCLSPKVAVNVTIVPPFAVTVAASQNPVCSGTPFTLTASSAQTGLTYQWSPAASFNNTSQNPASLSITANTTFNVTASTAAGCTGTGSLAVTVLPAPVLNVVAATPAFCPGQSTILTASNAGPTYNWSPATGLSATTGAIVTATPAATTTYTVTSPAASGTCAASGSVTVTVNPTPSVNAGLDAAICAGSNTTLAATGAVSYSWSPTAGLSASNISNPVANPTTTTTYTVTGTSAQGCTSTDQVIVTVNPVPVANPGSGAANCSGTGAQLNGSGGVSYQWSPATGLSSAVIANPIANPASTTNYTLTVTGANGCVSAPSAPITVTVFQQPAAPIITPNGPLAFCQGGSVQLTAPASSAYLWSNGATTQSITVSQSGNYSVQITDVNGCTSPVSSTSAISINPLPAVPTITASGPLTFCNGGSVSLTSSASNSYAWNTGVTNQTIVVQNSGTFSVTVTNANGCQASSATTTVTEHPPLVELAITSSGPVSFCPGSSVTLTAPASASYLWSNGATTQNITTSVTGTYSVILTDANGCVAPPSFPVNTTLFTTPATPTINSTGNYPVCIGQTAQLSSSPGTQYFWSSGPATQNISVTTAGAYTVRIADANGCQSLTSAPFNVTFFPLPAAPTISAVGPSTFCNGETVDLQASGLGSVVWNNGSTGTLITVGLSGQYTATLTDDNGCTSNNSSSFQVNVLATPANANITASGPTEICFGDSILLSCTSAPIYTWSNGASSQSIWVSESGDYTVEISGTICPPSSTIASSTVQVRPLPIPDLTASIYRDCLPSDIQFSMTTPGIGPFSYLWSFGDGSRSVVASPEHKYIKAGFYDVSLTLIDGIGCKGSNSLNEKIEILPRLYPAITIYPRTATISQPHVTLVSQTQGAIDFVWDLGDLGVFTGDTVYITLPDTGTWQLEYSVITDSGCETSLKDELRLIEDFTFFIPSGFSPNDDGLNDLFVPICNGILTKGYEFLVFNRWGEEVFSTNTLNKGWDGKDAPLGVYTWRISGRSLLGDDKIITGHVTLVR